MACARLPGRDEPAVDGEVRHPSPVLEALLDNYYDAARPYDEGRYRADTAGQVVQWVPCEFGASDPAWRGRMDPAVLRI